MSWIDRVDVAGRRREHRIRRVWQQSIAPAGAKLRARDVDVLDSPRDDAESWYSPVEPDSHFVEIDDIEHALARLWERQGMPELAATAADIAALVELLRDDAPQRATLDSNVYAMY